MAPSRRKGSSKAAAAAAARRQWKVGDLVLAKVKGFPAWPATVSEPEKWGYAADLKKVLVYFFGTQQIAFCNPADVEAFTEEKKESLLVKRHGKGSDFVRAVHEIIESYEKLKKEDQVNNSNPTDDQSLVSESINTESLTQNLSKDESSVAASQSCRRKTYSSAVPIVNGKSEDAITLIEDDLQDTEMLSKEVSSAAMAAETGTVNTYLTRGRSESSQAQKNIMNRQPSSTRRTRSSARADANKLQGGVTMTSVNYAKNAVHDGANAVQDGSARRNKRIRKSPTGADRHDVYSPDLVSNCTNEGNDSEILTADSDTISLNDGSTVESDCKTIQPESVNELCQREAELSGRLEFQANAVIHKKKRKPSRKRATSDATEFTVKSDEKVASGADTVKTEHNMPSDHERSTERYCKDDGDEHLPLVKRARVRMGGASSIGEGPETSQDTEDKPREGSNSISEQDKPREGSNSISEQDKPAEGSNSISELVHVSSNKEVDGSTDQSSSLAKEDTGNSSIQSRFPARKPQMWEVRRNQFGGSLDVEAALPPSKRLHRALEAMSANAAESNQVTSDEPSKIEADNIGHCSSSPGIPESLTERKPSNGFLADNVEKSVNTCEGCSTSDYSAMPELPVAGGRISSADVAASITSANISGESPKLESSKHMLEMLACSDGKHHPESSRGVVSEAVVQVESPNLLSCNDGQGDAGDKGSQDLVMPPDDCNTGRLELVQQSAKPDLEISHLDSNHVAGGNSTIQSPNNATSMLIDCSDDRENEATKSCQLLPADEHDNQNSVMFRSIESGQTERGSSATSSSARRMEVLGASLDNQNLHSDSTSDGQSGEKAVSVTLSSSSLTDGLDSVARATPHTSTCNASGSDNISIQVNGFCSPAVQSCSDAQRSATNWNSKEADNGLASFMTILRTLTRTKESIGRATRVAIDCAKYGVAAKVVEILAHGLEREASLHRRVDLFFLVDSIAQCSKGLRGDVGGVYPSAILAVLPRLLSAAAPPGSSSQENRRQCLKVLRVWQERKILPESIIRHHIRELDSLCSSSCSRAFSRRPLRNERAIDDPIREMEGLVDEYGSNSSCQLLGFRMAPMLRDEDDGIDSDGEDFEAVTPEHNAGKPGGERIQVAAVEKHRHILEDVDGELEMEDVAPSSEAFVSTSSMTGTENSETFHPPPGNSAGIPFAPPLPQDVPPRSPPLPTSPPPPPQPTSFPRQSERLDSLLRSLKSKDCADREQSAAAGFNPTVSDSIHYSAQGSDDYHPRGSKRASNSTTTTFSSPPVSNPVVRAVNNIPSADGAFNKGFRLRPPHPAPSNQFSFVHADQRVQSRRDIPPPSHPNRFHMQNAENGNFYRDRDRMKMAPVDIGDRWRPPPFPGPRYPDGSGMHYAPAPYAGQHREPAFPNHRYVPSRGMNHRELMPYRPPAGGPIPVAARGHNFWRPR